MVKVYANKEKLLEKVSTQFRLNKPTKRIPLSLGRG